MRGVVLHGAGDVRVQQRLDPKIEDPKDAVIRIEAACVLRLGPVALPRGRAR